MPQLNARKNILTSKYQLATTFRAKDSSLNNFHKCKLTTWLIQKKQTSPKFSPEQSQNVWRSWKVSSQAMWITGTKENVCHYYSYIISISYIHYILHCMMCWSVRNIWGIEADVPLLLSWEIKHIKLSKTDSYASHTKKRPWELSLFSNKKKMVSIFLYTFWHSASNHSCVTPPGIIDTAVVFKLGREIKFRPGETIEPARSHEPLHQNDNWQWADTYSAFSLLLTQ